MNETKQLTKAILSVMKAVKGIDKTLTVGSGQNSYKGVSDQVVKQVIGEAMLANGLCILPIRVDATAQLDRWETEYQGSKQSKQSVFTYVATKYLLMHESGESVEIAGYGHGVDSQDKSAGKATTYALKYALLYTFLVPTGHIDDTDKTHSDDIATPKPKAEKPHAPKPILEYTKEIMKEVDACTTKEELTAVWKKYPELGKINEDFKADVTNKGIAL